MDLFTISAIFWGGVSLASLAAVLWIVWEDYNDNSSR